MWLYVYQNEQSGWLKLSGYLKFGCPRRYHKHFVSGGIFRLVISIKITQWKKYLAPGTIPRATFGKYFHWCVIPKEKHLVDPDDYMMERDPDGCGNYKLIQRIKYPEKDFLKMIVDTGSGANYMEALKWRLGVLSAED